MTAISRTASRIAAILLLSCSVLGGSSLAQAETPVTPDQLKQWVKQLGERGYHQRFAAVRHLEESGLAARSSLLEGLEDSSLEVRVQCQRLLSMLAGSEREAELERLVFHYQSGHVYALPAWEFFRRQAGDDPSHRALYAQLVRTHGQSLRWLESLTFAEQGPSEEIATIPESLGLESQRLADADPIDWALLLLTASHPRVRHTPTLISQVYSGLLDGRVSSKLLREGGASPLMSLIESWVAAQDEPLPRRSLVQVCLRYRLTNQANALSQRILQQGAAPSATQYALLALTKLKHPEIDRYLKDCLQDERVCHTWQVVGTTRRIVRTEVRDTAMALLMHSHGFDPREYGYADIQADPDTMFRDFSMGFTSSAAREDAHAHSRETLGIYP